MKHLVLVVVLLLVAVIAAAQTKPINPRVIEMTVDAADYANATRIDVAYFAPGATSPVQAPVSIGKPPNTATGCTPPNVDPCVRGTINTMPLPFGMDYTGKARIVGVTATTPAVEVFSEWSDASNPFDRAPGKPGKPVVK